MVKSIIEGVADFFKDCPLLNAGVFRVDALGDEPQEYTIETGIFNPIIETYIDGSSDRRYQFNFGSREYYNMDRLRTSPTAPSTRTSPTGSKLRKLQAIFRSCRKVCTRNSSACSRLAICSTSP